MKQYKVYKSVTTEYFTVVEAETSKEAEQMVRDMSEKNMDYLGIQDEDVCAWLVLGE